MIPGLNFFPVYSPTGPCEVLKCDRRHFRVDVCREEGCGYRWMREAAEDRQRKTERDQNLTVDQKADGEKHINNGVLRIATAACCLTVAVEEEEIAHV